MDGDVGDVIGDDARNEPRRHEVTVPK